MSEYFDNNRAMTMVADAFGASRQLQVRSLRMIETAMYSPRQFTRPFMPNVTADTLNIFTERLNRSSFGNTMNLAASTFSGMGENILVPSAAPEKQIIIPNGWDTRRFRFIMEVVVPGRLGGSTVEMIIGYTDYNGASRMSGAIDGTMTFYINRVLTLTSYSQRTPLGVQEQYTIGDRSNIIADNDYGGIYSNQRLEFIRPSDIFGQMSRDLVMSGLDNGEVFDETCAVTNVAQKSAAGSVIAPSYLAKVVNGYIRAKSSNDDMLADVSSVIEGARQGVRDNSVVNDPFMSKISRLGEFRARNYFTWNELLQIDPTVDDRTQVIFLANAELRSELLPGSTADWGAADRHTQVATMIGHGVAGLLMESGMTAISFLSTNEQIGSMLTTTITELPSLTGIDMSPHARAFIARFEQEIMADVTFNGQVPISLMVVADTVREIRINMRYGGEPEQLYVVPAFADSLLSPLVTQNRALGSSIASSLENLFNAATDVMDSKKMSIGNFKNPSLGDIFDNNFALSRIPVRNPDHGGI